MNVSNLGNGVLPKAKFMTLDGLIRDGIRMGQGKIDKGIKRIAKRVQRCYEWLEMDEFIRDLGKNRSGKIYSSEDWETLDEIQKDIKTGVATGSWIERLRYWLYVAIFLENLAHRFPNGEIGEKVSELQNKIWEKFELGEGPLNEELTRQIQEYQNRLKQMIKKLKQFQQDWEHIGAMDNRWGDGMEGMLGESYGFEVFCMQVYDGFWQDIESKIQDFTTYNNILRLALQMFEQIGDSNTDFWEEQEQKRDSPSLGLGEQEVKQRKKDYRIEADLDDFCQTTEEKFPKTLKDLLAPLEKQMSEQIKLYNAVVRGNETKDAAEKKAYLEAYLLNEKLLERLSYPKKRLEEHLSAEADWDLPFNPIEEVLMRMDHMEYCCNVLLRNQQRMLDDGIGHISKKEEILQWKKKFSEVKEKIKNEIINLYLKNHSDMKRDEIPLKWNPYCKVYKQRLRTVFMEKFAENTESLKSYLI